MQIIVRSLKHIRKSKIWIQTQICYRSFFELDHRFVEFFTFDAATREFHSKWMSTKRHRNSPSLPLSLSSAALGKSIFFMNKIDIYSRDIHSLILSTFMYVIILVGRRRNAKPKLINGIVVQLSSVSCRAGPESHISSMVWNEIRARASCGLHIYDTYARHSPLSHQFPPRTHTTFNLDYPFLGLQFRVWVWMVRVSVWIRPNGFEKWKICDCFIYLK